MTTGLRAPASGDIVIRKRSAVDIYELSVVPGPPQLIEEKRASAVAWASGCALEEGVDVWFTEDSVQFICMARNRARRGAVQS